MSDLWTEKEDAVLLEAYKSGLMLREIAASMSEAGYRRSIGACKRRIERMREASHIDSAKPLRRLSDPLADALRVHHPGRGCASVVPSRTVPLRKVGEPIFSVTGSHF